MGFPFNSTHHINEFSALKWQPTNRTNNHNSNSSGDGDGGIGSGSRSSGGKNDNRIEIQWMMEYKYNINKSKFHLTATIYLFVGKSDKLLFRQTLKYHRTRFFFLHFVVVVVVVVVRIACVTTKMPLVALIRINVIVFYYVLACVKNLDALTAMLLGEKCGVFKCLQHQDLNIVFSPKHITDVEMMMSFTKQAIFLF